MTIQLKQFLQLFVRFIFKDTEFRQRTKPLYLTASKSCRRMFLVKEGLHAC